MLLDNGHDNVTVIVDDPAAYAALDPEPNQLIALIERGAYRPDRSLAAADRFRAGATPYDAVRVTTRQRGVLYFAKSLRKQAPQIETRALARATQSASFSVGSRLFRLDGGVLNALLGAALGSEINLSGMQYDSLLDSQVRLFDLFGAAATELDLTAGTYDDILNADWTYDQFASALMQSDGLSVVAEQAISTLIQDTRGDNHFALSDLIDLGPVGDLALAQDHSLLDVDLSALEMLTAAALAASDDHQLAFDLNLDGPRLIGLDLTLSIGEREQHVLNLGDGTSPGAVARTAQTRLATTARVGGTGLLDAATLQLPLYLEVARGEAQLTDVRCNRSKPYQSRATIAARPGIAALYLGEPRPSDMTDFATPAQVDPASIVDLPLLKVTGKAAVEMGNQTATPLNFTYNDVRSDAVKRVSTREAVRSLTGSILQKADLDIAIAGLNVGARPVIGAAVGTKLSQLAAPLDQVVNSLLAALGLSLGELDVRVHDISCGHADLVQ
jgi:uncharacterized membrane protein